MIVLSKVMLVLVLKCIPVRIKPSKAQLGTNVVLTSGNSSSSSSISFSDTVTRLRFRSGLARIKPGRSSEVSERSSNLRLPGDFGVGGCGELISVGNSDLNRALSLFTNVLKESVYEIKTSRKAQTSSAGGNAVDAHCIALSLAYTTNGPPDSDLKLAASKTRSSVVF